MSDSDDIGLRGVLENSNAAENITGILVSTGLDVSGEIPTDTLDITGKLYLSED